MFRLEHSITSQSKKHLEESNTKEHDTPNKLPPLAELKSTVLPFEATIDESKPLGDSLVAELSISV